VCGLPFASGKDFNCAVWADRETCLIGGEDGSIVLVRWNGISIVDSAVFRGPHRSNVLSLSQRRISQNVFVVSTGSLMTVALWRVREQRCCRMEVLNHTSFHTRATALSMDDDDDDEGVSAIPRALSSCWLSDTHCAVGTSEGSISVFTVEQIGDNFQLSRMPQFLVEGSGALLSIVPGSSEVLYAGDTNGSVHGVHAVLGTSGITLTLLWRVQVGRGAVNTLSFAFDRLFCGLDSSEVVEFMEAAAQKGLLCRRRCFLDCTGCKGVEAMLHEGRSSLVAGTDAVLYVSRERYIVSVRCVSSWAIQSGMLVAVAAGQGIEFLPFSVE
jgi:hypothetical protein